MKKIKNTLLLIPFIVIFLLWHSEAIAFKPVYGAHVEFQNNQLMVSAKRVPLVMILREITRETGLEFVSRENLSDKTVSLNFQGLSLDEGLDRVLENCNYLNISKPDGEILKVIILKSARIAARSPESNFGRPSSGNPEAMPTVKPKNRPKPINVKKDLPQTFHEEEKGPKSIDAMVRESLNGGGMNITDESPSMVIDSDYEGM